MVQYIAQHVDKKICGHHCRPMKNQLWYHPQQRYASETYFVFAIFATKNVVQQTLQDPRFGKAKTLQKHARI